MLMVAVFLSVTSLPGNAAPAEKWPTPVIIGSFEKGSSSYPTNVAMARLVSKYAPAKAVVREYAGGAPGLDALVRGYAHTWAVGQNDFINAYYGTGLWKDKPQNIRLLIGAWYVGPTGFGIRPREGMNSIKDLAGKKCMVKSFIPYQNKLVETIMRQAGVWDKATIIEMAATGDINPAMIEKKVDCFYHSIGGAYTLELKTAVGVDWISLTEEEQRAGLAVTPGQVAYTAPRWILEMYGYPPNKVLRSTAYCQGIAVHADMADHVAFGILDAVYSENRINEVRSVSQDLNDSDIKLAVKYSWLPFHAGAVKFYKEKGVWTDEMEAKQKEFLAKRGLPK